MKQIHKRCLFIILGALILTLTSCADQENNDKKPQDDTELVQAEEWFVSQYSRYAVLDRAEHSDAYILLTGDKHPEVEGLYTSFCVFIIQKDADTYSITATKTAQPALSAGFSAAVLSSEDMTIVFGDISDGVYDFRLDKIIKTEFLEACIIYDKGKEEVIPIYNLTPYMFIFDDTVKVEDIKYCSKDVVASYSESIPNSV